MSHLTSEQGHTVQDIILFFDSVLDCVSLFRS